VRQVTVVRVVALALAAIALAGACSGSEDQAAKDASAPAAGTGETGPARQLEPTPAQAEGPFYPVAKPDDRDNDLTVVRGTAGPAQGDVLELSGRVVAPDGRPVPGAVIEIWQVDATGAYLHPDDPGVGERDPRFQGYGEDTADELGRWTFRTLDPVHYETRPRHIHMRVLVDGAPALTTQVYFTGDPFLQSDGLAAAAGDDLGLLVVEPASAPPEGGRAVHRADHRIVLAQSALAG
jgi:protocatechuate 3,4-dioxygenase beta subunit